MTDSVPAWRQRTNAEKCRRMAEVAKAGLAAKAPEAIAARAEAAEQKRREYEAACLAAERRPISGAKRRPLSKMPA